MSGDAHPSAAVGLWRVRCGDAVRLARGPAHGGPVELLADAASLGELLAGDPGSLEVALSGRADGPVPPDHEILAPVDEQEVWAAGVTYARSRDARMEESDTPDPYDKVYEADRPELFFKAAPGRSQGPGQPIGIRADSGWDVPEPELGVVADRRGRIAGYLIGNDVSSRSIEGANPLYLPQAKVYTRSCALGPCVVPVSAVPDATALTLRLVVRRGGQTVVDETVHVSQMRRTVGELLGWLYQANDFPRGVVVLTGTPVVPDPEFSLQPGDDVVISCPALGTLRNRVDRVGQRRTAIDRSGRAAGAVADR